MTDHLAPDHLAPDHPPTGGGPLRAVLFDMDGTLLATEQYWDEALVELAAGWGATVGPAALAATAGVDLEGAMAIVREAVGVPRSPAETEADHAWVVDRVEALMASSVTWQPGARDLLLGCLDAGLRTALVTTTPRALVTHVLRHLRADLGREPFELVVCGDEVPARKPDPAPYLQAMTALDLQPGECVVVEDSLTGSRAGLAAGCRVLAVPAGQVLPGAPGLTVVTSLVGVTPGGLAGLAHPVPV